MVETLFRYQVSDFSDKALKEAQSVALIAGYNPSRHSKIKEQGTLRKYYTFSKDGINQLPDGRYFYKANGYRDNRGVLAAKVFLMDGKAVIIKDERLTPFIEKWYKSMAGVVRSK